MRVTVENVAWSVRDVTIIEKIDALFEPGTFTGLLGPNGSGKTTLLNVVAGLRKPTHGTVRANAESVHALSGRVRARRIALVEQHAHTGLELRVREVVELGRVPHQGMFGGSQHASIADAMKLARIEHLGDRSWQTLSGGERQRTQLARALAQQPSLLLLDEPTNHLDLGHQLDFLETVRGLGVTTVAALHDLELAAAYCDRLVVLKGGRIVAAGAVGDVLTADLLDEVYGVRATVTPHPSTGRPHLTWHGTTGALHG